MRDNVWKYIWSHIVKGHIRIINIKSSEINILQIVVRVLHLSWAEGRKHTLKESYEVEWVNSCLLFFIMKFHMTIYYSLFILLPNHFACTYLSKYKKWVQVIVFLYTLICVFLFI